MTTDIYADVTFSVPDDAEKINALHAKAREIDEDEGVDVPEQYTLAQALQIVWHREPEWLHGGFLIAWTIDAAAIEGGTKQPIWGTR